METMVLKNGRLLDLDTGESFTADLIIADGKVKQVGRGLSAEGIQVRDLSGKLVIPGLIDMHIHLREPGFEEKETIATGTRQLPGADLSAWPVCPIPSR